jgi:hypothetical protein
MRHTTVFTVLLAGLMVSCATAKLDTARPLQIDASGFSTTYRQGGQRVGLNDLEQALMEHPVSGSRMDGYQPKKWTGMLLGAAGGGLIGWNIGDNLTKSGRKDWALAVAGASVIAVSLPFSFAADRQMRSAAEVFNGSVAPPRSSGPAGPVPYVSFLPEPRHGKQCVAGLTMAF